MFRFYLSTLDFGFFYDITLKFLIYLIIIAKYIILSDLIRFDIENEIEKRKLNNGTPEQLKLFEKKEKVNVRHSYY